MSLAYLDTQELQPSYYEASVGERVVYPTLGTTIECEVCVVGGGLAGLHTALNLAEQGIDVVLLEARRIGWGASGRNGGHVIPEYACGMAKLEAALGKVSAQHCWQLARDGADTVRERIKRHNIDCHYRDGHIEAAISPRHVAALKNWQQHAEQNYRHDSRWLNHDDMLAAVGSRRYLAGLLDTAGGHLHPLRFTLGMARAFVAAGGRIYEQSAVSHWQDGATLKIHCHHTQDRAEVHAKTLVLACNIGMASIQQSMLQNLAKHVLPVGTWMIATAPLPAPLAQTILPSRVAIADNRTVLDYFRLSEDQRMLFGGGCSYQGQASPAGFARSLRHSMLKVFPQLSELPIDYAWGGIMDISLSRTPDFGCLPTEAGNVYYAHGFSGSGLVATAVAGRVIAEAIIGEKHNLALFMRLRHLPFPGGKRWRGALSALGMLWYRLKDYL